MTKQLKAGDKVSWKSHAGTAEGEVVRKVTSRMKIKGHEVAASKEQSEYLVKTRDGKKAAHKLHALTKR